MMEAQKGVDGEALEARWGTVEWPGGAVVLKGTLCARLVVTGALKEGAPQVAPEDLSKDG